MAIGNTAKPVLPSYVAVGKESTWGTYASATTAIDFISCSFKTEIESQKLDTIGTNRGFTKRVQLSRMVQGTLESFLHPVESTLLLAAAMGGTLSTTAGSTGAYTHSISTGNFNTTSAIQNVSFNVRKGDSFVWRYIGGRVNNLKITANVGEVVKVSFDMVFKDSTQLSDDIGSTLSLTSILPMTFVNGKFRYAATEAAAATTTAEEDIQTFEFNINNNLVNDGKARSLGTDLLTVLPPTRRDVTLSITQRFDTTTSYNRFIQATQGAVELFFRGPNSISAANFNEMTFRMPKVFQNSNDPTLDSAGDIVSSTFTYDVLVDLPSTATGKDIGVTVRNGISAY